MTNKSKGCPENLWIPDAKCPKCGKVFIPAPLHIYREGDIFYCSWNCFNHRHDGMKKVEKRTSRPVEMIGIDGEVIKTFKDSLDAAIYLDGYEQDVRAACRGEKKLYKGFMWRYKRENEMS